MVALPKSRHTETMPSVLLIKRLGTLECNVNVATIKSEIEAGTFVFNKVESNLDV